MKVIASILLGLILGFGAAVATYFALGSPGQAPPPEPIRPSQDSTAAEDTSSQASSDRAALLELRERELLEQLAERDTRIEELTEQLEAARQAATAAKAEGGEALEGAALVDAILASSEDHGGWVQLDDDLVRALHERAKEDPDGVLQELLARFRENPSPALLQLFGTIHPSFLPDGFDLASYATQFVDLALASGDVAVAKALLQQLAGFEEKEIELSSAQRAAIFAFLQPGTDPELRTRALSLLGRMHEDNPQVRSALLLAVREGDDARQRRQAMHTLARTHGDASDVRQALLDVARNDPEPRARMDALRTLGDLRDPRGSETIVHILSTETDTELLMTIANIDTLGDPNRAGIKAFKEGTHALLHREVDDSARAMAALSASMIAIIDGDENIHTDLEHLASTASLPGLAETARQASTMLRGDEASFEGMQELWRGWFNEHVKPYRDEDD